MHEKDKKVLLETLKYMHILAQKMKGLNQKIDPKGAGIFDDILSGISSTINTVANAIEPVTKIVSTVAPLLEGGNKQNGGDIFGDIENFLGLGINTLGRNAINMERKAERVRVKPKQFGYDNFDEHEYRKQVNKKVLSRGRKAGDYNFDDGGDYNFDDGGDYSVAGDYLFANGGMVRGRSRRNNV